MNKAFLVGNLTRDPELSTIPNGTAVCKFSIAVNRRFADAEGNRQTDFFNIVAWRGLAENCNVFLSKGSKVGISGSIQTRSYDDKDGAKRYVTEIVADEVEFLSNKSNDQQKPSSDANEDIASMDNDELPF